MSREIVDIIAFAMWQREHGPGLTREHFEHTKYRDKWFAAAQSGYDALTAANLLIVPREVVEEAAGAVEDMDTIVDSYLRTGLEWPSLVSALRSYLPTTTTQPDRKEGM